MISLKNKTAAITGAASGIGRMLAINLAKEGCNLALATRKDEAGLNETASLTGGSGKVSTHMVDVSNYDQVCRFAKETTDFHGSVDIIINNAGVALSDFIETVSLEDFEWLMNINFWGVVYGTKVFLPYLKKRPSGYIVNVSSMGGIIPNPNLGAYSASKFAVKGFTEALFQEMHGTNIVVSCVYPGAVKTNIAHNTKFNNAMHSLTKEQLITNYNKDLAHTSADSAAKIIIKGLKRGKLRILIGNDAKIQDLFVRLLPVTTTRIIGWYTQFIARKWATR